MNFYVAVYLAGFGLASCVAVATYLLATPPPSRALLFTFGIFALAWPITAALVAWVFLMDLMLGMHMHKKDSKRSESERGSK